MNLCLSSAHMESPRAKGDLSVPVNARFAIFPRKIVQRNVWSIPAVTQTNENLMEHPTTHHLPTSLRLMMQFLMQNYYHLQKGIKIIPWLNFTPHMNIYVMYAHIARIFHIQGYF